MDINLNAIISQQREENDRKNTLSYQFYSNKLLGIGEESKQGRYLRKYSKKLVFREDLDCEMSSKEDKDENTLEKEHTLIRVSPELSVIWNAIKRERDPVECERITRELLEKSPEEGGCKIIEVKDLQNAVMDLSIQEKRESLKWMWFATTENGIELHPGLIDKKDPEAVTLGDDCVHALMAGRTGAGKSIALHAIISGLMQEYAPWELNINLADFKIVELSKYGNGKNKAPHVAKIAATDSMEYVLSIMYDMYENMEIRQKVFAALGIQKLSDYRKKFNVVLPREILIVDEFQQMYELATQKQIGIIDRLIKMITKLGRATGYHLFFTSQSMTGTVSSDTIANFKLRLCLSANEDISNRVLGNKAASELTGTKGKGYLIANDEGGAKDYNKEYQVPLLVENEDSSGDLADILRISAELAKRVGFDKDLDFYKEDFHRRLKGEEGSFEKDYDQFLENSMQVVAKSEEVDLFLLLGDSCVYAKKPQKKTTLEYTPLKIGDRKNIVCIGDSVQQRVYLMKFLQMQYSRQENMKNYIVHGDVLAKELLEIPEGEFVEIPIKECTKKIRETVENRRLLWELIQYPAEEQTFQKMVEIYAKQHKISTKNISADTISPVKIIWAAYLKGGGKEGVGGFRFKNLKRVTFWMNGFHLMTDMLDEWRSARNGVSVEDLLKVCTNMGVRFVFVGTKLGELSNALRKCMGYSFIMSDDDDNFMKAGMQPNKAYRDDVIRFRAANEVLNQQKPGLYVLEQDEKFVKTYTVDDVDEENTEAELFRGIEG